MLARAIMTADVVTLSPSDTLQEAALRMMTRGISGAPVVDDEGRLVGILGESDILRHIKRLANSELSGRYLSSSAHSLQLLALLAERGHPAVKELMDHLRTALVREAMTEKVVTAPPGATMEEVIALMIRSDINRVPIVERGKVVGIITRGDVVRMIAKA
ncbi:MAG TPA: CBS domain-containing protein [Thermoplasmata archaeon]|nr:CBS domain-containing protein [Thermoplasmata archaeon]